MATPVILDTDIGSDIDDTWALAMLLGCPELDVRLVTTASGDTTYRARLAAGILAAGGRDDVPVGIGPETGLRLSEGFAAQPQGDFAAGVSLDAYRGGIHSDGVGALVDCVMSSPEPVTIVTIGPVTNIAAALEREPAITGNARLIGMLGSIHTGVRNEDGPVREYNVIADIPACRATLSADWDVTLAPLDTCGFVVLRDERYQTVRTEPTHLMRTVMRNYDEWASKLRDHLASSGFELDAATRSSILFDTMAVWLAYDESLADFEQLPIELDEEGIMRITPGAPEVRAATAWRDRDAFEDHVVERLLAASRRA
jgi:inosine-uridine nucleoside N-ribohydrolase